MDMRFKETLDRALGTFNLQVKRLRHEDVEVYRRLYGDDVLARKPFYNVGAGGFRHPCWTNVDHPSEWYADIQRGTKLIEWDLLSLKPVNIEDGVAEVVYSCHTLEHVTDDAVAHCLREAHRVLKPGGVLRLTMPDMELIYRAYQNEDRLFFTHYFMPPGCSALDPAIPMHELFLARFASSTAGFWNHQGRSAKISEAEFKDAFARLGFGEAMNYCCGKVSLELQRRFPGNHVNWFTHEKLLDMLGAAGFRNAWISGYGKSLCPILRNTDYFDNRDSKSSVFVEARKG